MNEISEPNLAPPGAGLPLVELVIGRLLFRLRRWTGSRKSFDQKFTTERRFLHDLVISCDPNLLGKRVLIRRGIGMEDSSRYWSILMTLDHLRIVNTQLVEVFERLPQGRLPDRKADTAAVKPDPAVGQSVIADYEASCDALLRSVAAVSNLKTETLYPHPWFGPMDAFAWHAMAGMHLGIHRKQIESILRGL